MSQTGKDDLLHQAVCAETKTAVVQAELRNSLHRLIDATSDDGSSVRILAFMERFRNKMLDSLDYLEIAEAPGLGRAWRSFLVCYDDYVEAIRQAECDIAHDAYWNMTAPSPPALSSSRL